MKRNAVVALMLAMSLTVAGTSTSFAMDNDFTNETVVSDADAQGKEEASVEKVHQVYLSILKPGTEVAAGTDWHEVVKGVTTCKECGFQGNVSDVRLVSGSLDQVGEATLVFEYSVEENGVVHQGRTSATYQVTSAVNPEQKYKITAKQPDNGVLSLSSETAKEGETVTIKVEPQKGYHVTNVSVTGVPVSEKENNMYTFQMPARDVTVSAEIISDSISETHKVYISALKPGSDVVVGTDWHEVITGVTKCKKCGFEGQSEKIRLLSGSLDKVGKATLEVEYSEEHNGILHEAVKRKYTYNVIEKVEESYNIHVNQELDKGKISLDKTNAKEGEPVNISVTANEGYEFDGIQVTSNGKDIAVSDNGNGNYSFVMPAGDVEVSATFRETVKPVEKYKVNVSNSEGGIVEVDTNEAEAGATVAITATAKNGYELEGVNVSSNGSPVSVNDNGNGTFTFIMPTGDVNVSAVFVQKETPVEKYSIINGHQNSTRGTISLDKTEAKAGETVTVTVLPKDGYVLQFIRANIIKITGPSGGQIIGEVQLEKIADNMYTFVMPAGDVMVRYDFRTDAPNVKHNIMLEQSGEGYLSASHQETFENQYVVISASPKKGYILEGVYVDGKKIEKDDQNRYSFYMPYKDVTVYANFVKESAEPFHISSEVNGNGTIEIDAQAFEGSIVTFSTKPTGENVKVESVVVKAEDGSEIASTDCGNGTYSFIMPKGNAVVSVKFVEEIPWTDLEPSIPVKPEQPEQKPEQPEQKPEQPEQKPDQKPEKPQKPEVNKENVPTKETKKEGTSPKTGDTTSALPIAGVGVASLGAVLAAILKKRK